MSMPPYRIGQGYDCHALVPSRPLIIGGVKIPHPTGLLGHSDADVLLHAITDALLGAAGHRAARDSVADPVPSSVPKSVPGSVPSSVPGSGAAAAPPSAGVT